MNVSVSIEHAGIAGVVVSGKGFEVGFLVAVVVVEEGSHETRGEGKLDRDGTEDSGFSYLLFGVGVEDLDVEAGEGKTAAASDGSYVLRRC